MSTGERLILAMIGVLVLITVVLGVTIFIRESNDIRRLEEKTGCEYVGSLRSGKVHFLNCGGEIVMVGRI